MDEVIYIVCATYNFVPNENLRDGAFFLMFGKAGSTVHLLNPKIRYR